LTGPGDWLERAGGILSARRDVVGVGGAVENGRPGRWGELDYYLNHSEWIAGRPQVALALAEPALRRCSTLAFPFGAFSSGYIHSQLVLLHRLEGDHAAAQAHVREMLSLLLSTPEYQVH